MIKYTIVETPLRFGFIETKESWYLLGFILLYRRHGLRINREILP